MPNALWSAALVAATALHLGFQLTVSLVVYPALVRTPADAWRERHTHHSRSIAPLVALVYGALLVACAGALVRAPDAGAVLAALASLATIAVNGAVAAPLHGRLARTGPDPGLLARLRVADLARTALAGIALIGAVLHVTG